MPVSVGDVQRVHCWQKRKRGGGGSEKVASPHTLFYNSSFAYSLLIFTGEMPCVEN